MKNIPEIDFDRESKMQINGFELIVLEELIPNLKKSIEHNPFQPHRLSFFAILVISDGEVNHVVDLKNHHLRTGDVMVISKGQIHAFDENSQYKGYLVLFTEAFMQKYMAPSTIAQIHHLYNYFLGQEKLRSPDQNQPLLRTINNELKRNSSSLPNIVGALFSIYLIKLNNKNKGSIISITNKNLDYFNQFKLLVEKNFSRTRNAKVYAYNLSISYKHLNEVCKEISKKTTKSFIDSYVILESKRMLVISSLSVKEIAHVLGFDESTNFLKYFKKHTKLTPVEFRSTFS